MIWTRAEVFNLIESILYELLNVIIGLSLETCYIGYISGFLLFHLQDIPDIFYVLVSKKIIIPILSKSDKLYLHFLNRDVKYKDN